MVLDSSTVVVDKGMCDLITGGIWKILNSKFIISFLFYGDIT
jgi:hypothetical protein